MRSKAPSASSLTRGTIRVAATAFLAAVGVFACGGEDPMVIEPPPPAVATTVGYDVSNLCAEAFPRPNDVTMGAGGASLLVDCPTPADPLEALATRIARQLGARSDAVITLPVVGSFDAGSLTSTATFSFTSSIAGSGALPPVLLLRQEGAATSTAGWSVVNAELAFVDGTIRVQPLAALVPGGYYVVVATQALKDAETPKKSLAASSAAVAITGSAPVVAGAFDGLDAQGAEVLERQRARLAPLVGLLSNASPAILPAQITSIHGFTVEPGGLRLEREIDAYYTAAEAGRFRFSATTEIVPLTDVYPGLPPVVYENVGEFRRGKIKAPKVLNAMGRIRDGWTAQVEEIDIPFTIALPRNVQTYPVVVLLPGFGRGNIDGRSLANEFAGGPRAAIMTIDLRCHGDRSPGADGVCVDGRTAEEIAALTDAVPNNGNPELVGGDLIPDASGVGFFPTDPFALRDTQIAAIIEAIHILGSLRQAATFGGQLSPNVNQLHFIGQGHAATIALAAGVFTREPTRTMTIQLPSAGIGYKDLIMNGPPEARAAFVQGLPSGLTEANLGAYLDRLESTVLRAFDFDRWGTIAGTRFRNGARLERLFLNHGSQTPFVNMAARQRLIQTFNIPSNRVSGHRPGCSDFFIFTCTLGDNPAWREEARRQIVTYVDSGGVSVTAPAP